MDLLGHRFTWSNECVAPTLVRLDRVFCTPEWEEVFPNHLLQSIAFGISDHCPLILNMHSNGPGKCRFHFESFWPKLDGFQDVVSRAWNEPGMQPTPCPIDRLASKLIAISRALQSWSRKSVGNISAQIGFARELLLRLNVAQESRPLTAEENWLRCNLKQHL